MINQQIKQNKNIKKKEKTILVLEKMSKIMIIWVPNSKNDLYSYLNLQSHNILPTPEILQNHSLWWQALNPFLILRKVTRCSHLTHLILHVMGACQVLIKLLQQLVEVPSSKVVFIKPTRSYLKKIIQITNSNFNFTKCATQIITILIVRILRRFNLTTQESKKYHFI